MLENAEAMHAAAKKVINNTTYDCEKACEKSGFNNLEFSAFVVSQLLTGITGTAERHGLLGRFLKVFSAVTTMYMSQHNMNLKIEVVKKTPEGEAPEVPPR